MLSFDDFEPHLHCSNDSLYVVNFWATWCTPCVDELPAFEKISREFSDRDVKVLLVSLDFPNQVESRLMPFLQKNDITAEVIVLNDPDANKWIDRVHPDWSGALPATVIYSRKNRDFYEKSFTYDELKQTIDTKLSEL